MVGKEDVCVSWREFEATAASTFKDLLSSPHFTDVTLATEDDEYVEAHRVILSASSPMFRRMFLRHEHQKPVVFLRGLAGGQLRSLLDYIYLGECSVASGQLASFLRVAGDLRVAGLAEEGEAASGSNHTKPSKMDEKLTKLSSDQTETKMNESSTDQFKEDVDLSKMVRSIGEFGQLMCNVCGFVCADKDKIKYHLNEHNKTNHQNLEHPLSTTAIPVKTEETSRKEKKTVERQIKEYREEVVADRQVGRQVQTYVHEKRRPFLGIIQRRGQVILCGDRQRVERVAANQALRGALGKVFEEEPMDQCDDQEYITDETVVIPPLFCPFKDVERGWSAKVAELQLLLYFKILGLVRGAPSNGAAPAWWPEALAFKAQYTPSHECKEDNESLLTGIFRFYNKDIYSHHL
jgi:hypothetical protein